MLFLHIHICPRSEGKERDKCDMILTKLLMHEWALHTTHFKRGSQLFNELFIVESCVENCEEKHLTAFKIWMNNFLTSK